MIDLENQQKKPIAYGERPLLTVGVVADTHVPDRVDALHPQLIPALKEAQVDLILHAGDICSATVIKQLETVAMVKAVAGNRDLFLKEKIPPIYLFELAGVPTALMHGQGTILEYWTEKLNYYSHGYRLKDYLPVVMHVPITTQLVIFGHTHYAENLIIDGLHLFNPGSAGYGIGGKSPSFGIVQIWKGGRIDGKIMALKGAVIKNRKWQI